MGLNQTKWDLIKRDKMLVETLNQTHGFFGEANHWILAAIVEINQANWD
jgi:aromatic ring hydroxylase